MKLTTKQNYRQRLTQVIDYIYRHIDQDLDVNTLADIACLSPYHFHRIYRQLVQETVANTVRRLRLQKAAALLLSREKSIKTIAGELGYSSIEAFSRAFSNHFGEVPSDYKTRYDQAPIVLEPFVASLPLQEGSKTMYEINIEEISKTQLLGLEHRGDYLDIGQAFEKLFIYAGTKDSGDIRSIGIYYDDPKSVVTENLRSVAGITVGNIDIHDDQDYKLYEIPQGKVASLLFKGPYSELDKAYDYFFGQWIPENNVEVADFPPFEEYLNDPKTTSPNELLTKVCCLIN